MIFQDAFSLQGTPHKKENILDVKDILFQPFLGFGKGQKTLNMR